jgi:beta-galactosidase
MRSLKSGRPFMLMESTPTFSNWQSVWKLKKPGMHSASSLLALAHGSDTVQYFQWRKSRGGTEKFHGAVLGHDGAEDTRVFAEVAGLGRTLAALDGVVGTRVPAQAAIVFDWENRWALEGADVVPAKGDSSYEQVCKRHHRPLWARGVAVDVINMERDFSPYRLLVAPMLCMIRPGVAERLEQFVRAGGTLVATYWSGVVDESDLCFLGGRPGPLRQLLGLRCEDVDALYPEETNSMVPVAGNGLGLSGGYEIRRFCELVHPESARVLATYGRDFYKGLPALTVNGFGDGAAYYLAADADERFLLDFSTALMRKLDLRRAIPTTLPEGVCAQVRTNGAAEYVFLLNFTRERRRVRLGKGLFVDVLRGGSRSGAITLAPFGVAVLKRRAASS